jgi:16S rRNA (guanine966-N2)-methyltransferase
MRIISGKYKGQSIIGYDIDGTRPTMDRVKESLFAILQDKLKNSSCLDLFAGSGNLGFEALSNGARSCDFVDNNKIAITTIRKNISNIKISEPTRVIHNDFISAINEIKSEHIKYDLIFLDPPYNDNLIGKSLRTIDKHEILSINGYIVCEFENEQINTDGYKVLKERKYGKKQIIILQKMH